MKSIPPPATSSCFCFVFALFSVRRMAGLPKILHLYLNYARHMSYTRPPPLHHTTGLQPPETRKIKNKRHRRRRYFKAGRAVAPSPITNMRAHTSDDRATDSHLKNVFKCRCQNMNIHHKHAISDVYYRPDIDTLAHTGWGIQAWLTDTMQATAKSRAFTLLYCRRVLDITPFFCNGQRAIDR